MISKFPLELMHRAGAPVRRPSPHSRGWKLRAPHREDRNPSFSVYKVDPSKPDEDPYAWAVMDFAEGLSMGLMKYLREFFGYETIGAPTGIEPKREPVKRSNLVEEVVRAAEISEHPPLPPEEYQPIIEANLQYRGHGFAKLGIDSRKHGIFLHPESKKPVILYRDSRGNITGIKERVGRPDMKYVWRAGNGGLFIARLAGNKTLIVAEGEFKAALFAELYPESDVIGVPSRSVLHKVPFWNYKRVLFVLDPDVAADLYIEDRMIRLHKLALAGLYLGTSVVALNFEEAFGVKDINDFVEQHEKSPDEIKAEVRYLVKSSARRIRPPKSLTIKNLPIVDVEKLDPDAAHLLTTIIPLVLSKGTWLNQCSIELNTNPLELMRVTGMSKSSLYRAIRKLERLNILDYFPGQLGQSNGSSPTLRFNFCKARGYFLTSNTPQRGTSLGLTSTLYIPKMDTPALADYHRVFTLSGGYIFTMAQYGVKHFVWYLIGRLTRSVIVKIQNLMNPGIFRAKSMEAKAIKETREHFYLRARELVIDYLRLAMPGTYVQRGMVHNPLWPYPLPLSALTDGMLVSR